MQLIEKFYKELNQVKLKLPFTKILVAVSGGIDSLALCFLANEYAKYNIQVNAIAPGYILTDLNKSFFDTDEGKEMIELIPQKRIGFAEELDGALLLLCSDAGSFMTGSIIRVDGGHVIG